MSDIPAVPWSALTDQELCLFPLLVQDCTIDEIAERMQLSKQMAKSLRQSIEHKLGTKDRQTLIRWAIYHGEL